MGEKETKSIALAKLYPELFDQKLALTTNDQEIIIATKAQYKNIAYAVGDIFVKSLEDCELPAFVIIDEILYVKKCLLCKFHQLNTKYYKRTLNAFEVERGDVVGIHSISGCLYPWPQISHKVMGVQYVVLTHVGIAWTL